MNQTKCKACGADIVFVPTPNGKDMPLDAKPEKRVTIIDGSDDGRTVSLRDAVTPRAIVVDTYVSHFSTCVAAQQFRRPR